MAGVAGRSGAKPKPTALKELAGNPGKRPLPENEPDIPKSAWAVPDCLSGAALDEWQRIVPILTACKVLTDGDYHTVMAYCLTVGEMIETARAREPIRSVTFSQFRSLASELGLTPASRARVQTIGSKEDDDAAFFS
jgi:phage terminase small subunit